MIHFFLGTKAQLIKTAPVLWELDARGHSYRLIDSGQHAGLSPALRKQLGVRHPNVSLSGHQVDVATFSRAARWLGQAAWRWTFMTRRWIHNNVFGGHGGLCVVHGDTLSTLLGCLYARRAGLSVAHLEAGLRSFRWRDPFPEEFIRVWCMRRADLLLVPDETACTNCRQMNLSGKIVRTHGNTIADSLRGQLESQTTSGRDPRSYVLATCHRLETIRSRRRLAMVVRMLNLVAEQRHLVLVLHRPTEVALTKTGLGSELHPEIEMLPMQSYFDFIALIRDADFVMADGGSIQEECALLDVPLLILRSHTERADGLGQRAQLANFQLSAVRRFLDRRQAKRHRPNLFAPGPAAIAADHLIDFHDGGSSSVRADRRLAA